jgi:transcriptional regulator with XRE-family HTH domain
MVGSKITEIRKLKGMSLSKLAEKAGISKGYLSNIETGIKENPSTEMLEKIAAALDVEVSDLFDKTPVEDKLDILEDDMKILFSKAQKLSKEDRLKVLKMMEIFEQENND